jgi:hypothetical protein
MLRCFASFTAKKKKQDFITRKPRCLRESEKSWGAAGPQGYRREAAHSRTRHQLIPASPHAPAPRPHSTGQKCHLTTTKLSMYKLLPQSHSQVQSCWMTNVTNTAVRMADLDLPFLHSLLYSFKCTHQTNPQNTWEAHTSLILTRGSQGRRVKYSPGFNTCPALATCAPGTMPKGKSQSTTFRGSTECITATSPQVQSGLVGKAV